MKPMTEKEGTIYTHNSISQHSVGKLEISTMAFNKSEGGIDFSTEITIKDDSKDTGYWGEVIFRGNLADLIKAINGLIQSTPKEEANGEEILQSRH